MSAIEYNVHMSWKGVLRMSMGAVQDICLKDKINMHHRTSVIEYDVRHMSWVPERECP
jgi:hypothetical protein